MKRKQATNIVYMKKFLLPIAFISTCGVKAQQFNLSSPGNNIEVSVKADSVLSYQVRYEGKTVVFNSPMGFEFAKEPEMGKGLVVIDKKEKTIRETWEPVVATKHRVVTNYCNELLLSLKEVNGLQRRMDLCFRAFNDGIAFRYTLYRSAAIGNRSVVRERTMFHLPETATAWVADYGSYTSSQESEFHPRPVKAVSSKTIAGLPLLVAVDSTNYLAITEAAIDNYPGFYIGTATDSEGALLTTKLSPLPGEKEDGVKARFSDSLVTPWRVIMLAHTPGKLIESEIVQNLNAPCALKETAWIKPGMSAWDHWWSGEVKVDMPTIRQYIDFASAQGWPYMLVDWQWYGPFNKPEADITRAAPQLDMPALLHYARQKNVRLWLWLYSSDVNRNNNFEKAFALYEQWGIAGVKIDFMDRDDQEMVNWYHDIIQCAARHHLLVDFHGAYKPDGIGRTWPNMITREGVMGEEYSKFSTHITPEHNVTLPFTRMLAGAMDYTPGGFLNVTKAQFRQGVPTEVMNTRCAELAKFVVYESPFMVDCDAPEHVLGQPGADFLRLVPTVWDDVKVLGGYPGEYIAIARRKGKRWFVAAMNNSTPNTFQLPLDFLPPGQYRMQSWSDAADAGDHPQNLVTANKMVKEQDVLSVVMAAGGGFVACITQVR